MSFTAGRTPHTQDAYRRDLGDFAAYLRQQTLTPTRLGGQADQDAEAIAGFLALSAGRANEVVTAYGSHLFARGRAPGTVGRRIGCLRSLVKHARMVGLVPWTLEVRLPRRELTRDTRGPSLETIAAMLATAGRQEPPTGPRDVALLRVAYDLALRVSELTRLDVADVDLKTGALWVLGKGRRTKELLTLPPSSREAVAAWLAVRGKDKGPLFLSFGRSNQRGRLSSGGVQQIIRTLGAAVGMKVWPHGLRHTAITQAIDIAATHGLSIDLVRQFSRHRTLQTLLVYRDQHENKQHAFAEWVSETLATGAEGRA